MKRLQRIGDGLGVVLDREVLDLLKVDAETGVEFEVRGGTLVLHFVRGSDREQMRERAERIMREHDDTFRKLSK